MKFLVSVSLFIGLVATSSFANGSDSSLKILSVKRGVLYFKNTRDLIGATIEIENEEHDLIEALLVEKTRTIVDFYFLAPGNYIVKVKKDDQQYIIEYFNK